MSQNNLPWRCWAATGVGHLGPPCSWAACQRRPVRRAPGCCWAVGPACPGRRCPGPWAACRRVRPSGDSSADSSGSCRASLRNNGEIRLIIWDLLLLAPSTPAFRARRATSTALSLPRRCKAVVSRVRSFGILRGEHCNRAILDRQWSWGRGSSAPTPSIIGTWLDCYLRYSSCDFKLIQHMDTRRIIVVMI